MCARLRHQRAQDPALLALNTRHLHAGEKCAEECEACPRLGERVPDVGSRSLCCWGTCGTSPVSSHQGATHPSVFGGSLMERRGETELVVRGKEKQVNLC